MPADQPVQARGALGKVYHQAASPIVLGMSRVAHALPRFLHTRVLASPALNHQPAPITDATRVLVYTACDSRYFFRFVPSLLASVYDRSPTAAVHLHIFNPTAEVFSTVERLRSHLSPLSISISWDFARVDRRDKRDRGTYYATMRFPRLRDIVRRTDLDIVAVDADCVFVGDAAVVAEACRGCDVSIHVRAAESRKTHIFASTMFLANTARAHAFLDVFADQCLFALNLGYRRWYLDQKLLTRCLETFQRRRRLTVISLPQAFADWTFGDDSVIWAAKGRSKDDNRLFIERQNALLRSYDLQPFEP